MKEFTCIVCGKKGFDSSLTKNKKYCSRACFDKSRRMKEIPCEYNEGVFCITRNCDTCGWNPEVEKKRKERLEKEHGRAELKPCPFCGGSVTIAKGGDNSMLWWFITRGNGENKCNCRLFMESESFPVNASFDEKVQKKQDLIEAWNRRAEDGK